MSQVQFAQVVGVHPMTISKWERGEVNPDGPAAHLMEALYQQTDSRPLEPSAVEEVLKAVATGIAVAGLVLLLIKVFGGKK